jgi:hypothetical protein
VEKSFRASTRKSFVLAHALQLLITLSEHRVAKLLLSGACIAGKRFLPETHSAQGNALEKLVVRVLRRL